MIKSSVAGLAALLLATTAGAAPTQRQDEAGVRAAENRWSEAFVTGDTETLDGLLSPDYVSVGATGKGRPKAEILAIAKAYAGRHPGEHAHPLPDTSTVRLIGATALVQHRSPADVSIDLFAFEHGRWIARYSQHTAVAPAT
ncbi:MAG: hypothetical protein JWP50_2214 [Phenylobacterium sp.]|nr:hypothetical protein [Phenylobacterium sp.]